MGKSTSSSLPRPPAVVILGHVDHGKTTLLDYIRRSHLQKKEAGGITQSIGAYRAEFRGQSIIFLDTPGHAAFAAMRSRGASIADLAVLVVAVDDGVKPQTQESIKYLLAAKLPFVVALNKVDKPGTSPETVKAELTQSEVFVEGYGGNTPVVSLSAKTGQGVDQLLENILLLAELEELPARPAAPLLAPVIEARKDMRRGNSVSALVKAGTLHVADLIKTPTASGKVRAIFSSSGAPLAQALPGDPIQILGFRTLPAVGEVITAGISSSVPNSPPPPLSKKPLTPVPTSSSPKPQLDLVLRANSLGSLEAIRDSLPKEINYLFTGTGDISESDVFLASGTKGLILGFNVRASSSVRQLAAAEGIILKTYSVIYELFEYLEKKVLTLLEPTFAETELGRAKVLKVFEVEGKIIAGCTIESGRLAAKDLVHLSRGSGKSRDAQIKSLRVGKDKISEVTQGQECGVLLSPNLDMKEKDVIIAYKKNETDEN